MPLLSTKNVLLRVIMIVALAEYFVMLILHYLPEQTGGYTIAVIDVGLLALLTTPPLYLWVIKPFVDARDEMLSKLSELASTDPLTQLANRRPLSIHLEKIIEGSVAHKVPAAVLLIDLDGFKLINDVHGHEIGDAVLVEVAARIRTITRSGDVASRLGGDEFVVVINRLKPDKDQAVKTVLRIAQKLINLVSKPIVIEGHALRVGGSVGIRLLGFDELDAKSALSDADAAMFRAKHSGGGCAIVFGQ